LFIIVVSLNVLVNHAIDSEFISNNLKFWVFATGIATYLSLSYILDFYNLSKVSRRRYVISQSIYITGLFVFIIFLFTILAFDVSFWRKPLLFFLSLTPIQIALWRFFFGNVFRIIPVTKNVLYVYDEVTEKNIKTDIAAINGSEIETFYKVKLTYSLSQNSAINKKFFQSAVDKVDAYIINTKDYSNIPRSLEEMMLRSIIKGKEVISFTSFYENIYEAMPLRSHNDSFYEILQFRNKKIRYLQRIFTYGINFLLSVIIGFIFLLSVPFVWFLNLFFNRGPLFYVQKRVGLHGKEFKIYKYRSMVKDAEKLGAVMATKNDNRITPFGKIIRVFRVDELPQIISVIKGNMQFIGPRPERKVFVDQLNEMLPFYNVRHIIKPGITGWAQVKYKYGENLEDSLRKLEYDLYYIKNKSITLDLRIIMKTITTVLFSRGI
ncbi:MAG: sugar transferase, partial [Flavobacteriaceae bacterium]